MPVGEKLFYKLGYMNIVAQTRTSKEGKWWFLPTLRPWSFQRGQPPLGAEVPYTVSDSDILFQNRDNSKVMYLQLSLLLEFACVHFLFTFQDAPSSSFLFRFKHPVKPSFPFHSS
jgi:hypothetical protein